MPSFVDPSPFVETLQRAMLTALHDQREAYHEHRLWRLMDAWLPDQHVEAEFFGRVIIGAC